MSISVLLPASARGSQPWRNGGGSTQTIAAHPQSSSMENFEWRISTATIERAGPFSVFPNVDRSLIVLHGMLDLTIGGMQTRLNQASPPFAFSGKTPAVGVPVDGPAHDLNIMTRRGLWRADVAGISSNSATTVASEEAVLFAAGPAMVRVGESEYHLLALDALRLSGHAATPLEIKGSAPAFLISLSKSECWRTESPPNGVVRHHPPLSVNVTIKPFK